MEVSLRVENLSKKLGDFMLENIDFSLDYGYVLGLIGRNGAGKTSLLNTILGIWTPEEGTIEIAGYDRVHDEIRAKNEMAFVTDECVFPMEMTPYIIGSIFGKVYDRFDFGHYRKLCRRFRLPMHKRLDKMSKGMVIKMQIAFAFSREAKLYIFDEPSAGLDPVFRKELVDLMFDLIEDGRRSVIFSTHLTDELDRIADYILFLEDGKQKLFEQKEELISRYKLVRGTREQIDSFQESIIGKRIRPSSSEALVAMEALNIDDLSSNRPLITTPTIEDIMYYFIKGSVSKDVGIYTESY